MKITDKIELYNCDNMELMAKIKDESINIILTDPPYLYLKNQKLEREFDEIKFFSECKRVLKKDCFIVLFGRGVSFYRWNCILNDLGFTFKEEIVWNKSYSSSPVLPISRVHETISIFSKGNGVINKVKVPYIEQKGFNIDSVISDIKRISSSLKNEKALEHLLHYVENDFRIDFEKKRTSNFNATLQTEALGNQCVTTLQSITEGMKEKSIINIIREHYKSIHPTQKPVRLLERLLLLVKKSDYDLILDPFGGSLSTMEAVYNLGLNGISCEIDKEYYDKGIERVKNHVSQLKLF